MDIRDLSKFLEAQEQVYESALTEIRNGEKRGHWMWFIFPQIKGLGFSSTSVYFAIEDLIQAQEYFNHPVLGKRLIEISNALLEVQGKSASKIFGNPDDLKLKSSMTLFSLIPQTNAVFEAVLEKYFDGKPDAQTIRLAG